MGIEAYTDPVNLLQEGHDVFFGIRYPGREHEVYLCMHISEFAIFADKLTLVLAQIRKSKSLFGIPVIEARLEQGRRPFIDVRFAA